MLMQISLENLRNYDIGNFLDYIAMRLSLFFLNVILKWNESLLLTYRTYIVTQNTNTIYVQKIILEFVMISGHKIKRVTY